MLGGYIETQMLSFAGLVCLIRGDFMAGNNGLKLAKGAS